MPKRSREDEKAPLPLWALSAMPILRSLAEEHPKEFLDLLETTPSWPWWTSHDIIKWCQRPSPQVSEKDVFECFFTDSGRPPQSMHFGELRPVQRAMMKELFKRVCRAEVDSGCTPEPAQRVTRIATGTYVLIFKNTNQERFFSDYLAELYLYVVDEARRELEALAEERAHAEGGVVDSDASDDSEASSHFSPCGLPTPKSEAWIIDANGGHGSATEFHRMSDAAKLLAKAFHELDSRKDEGICRTGDRVFMRVPRLRIELTRFTFAGLF